MTNDIRKKTVIPFIICLGFIAIGINSLVKGIDQHEIWRIVAASVGGLLFIGLAILLVNENLKSRKAGVNAE